MKDQDFELYNVQKSLLKEIESNKDSFSIGTTLIPFDEKDITLNLSEAGLYPCKSIFAVALGKTDFINEVVISYEGNEFDATPFGYEETTFVGCLSSLSQGRLFALTDSWSMGAKHSRDREEKCSF